MTDPDVLGRRYDRRAYYRVTLVLLHAACAVALGLTYLKVATTPATKPFVPLMPEPALLQALIVMWPFIPSGYLSVSRLTSQRSELWLYCAVLLACSVTMFVFLCDRLEMHPTTGHIAIGSFVLFATLNYVSHFIMGGLE